MYKDSYEHIRLERTDGILRVTLHTNGGELIWGYGPLSELGPCFNDIGNDPENEVVIITGTGSRFIGHRGPITGKPSVEDWLGMMRDAIQLTKNLLDIDVPTIGALNGPSTEHAEIALLCDVVLASENVTFQDAAHFKRGLVPGDGCHFVWPMLLGPNRGRYFMMTGQTITASEALELGLVGEVLPAERLLPRAYELAQYMRERPSATVRLSRIAITMEFKRQAQAYMGYGIALEAIGGLDEFPQPGEDEL